MMEVLLFALGVFGLLPIACMTLFYTLLPLVLIGLQVLGIASQWGRQTARPTEVTTPERVNRAA